MFFGISDLHKENIFFQPSRNKLYFFPIDIESLFFKYQIPSQSSLLSHKTLNFEKSGLSFLKEINLTGEEITAIIWGFITSTKELNKNQHRIKKTLVDIIGQRKIPIRLVIRNTAEYYSYFKEKKGIFTASESTQLKRNDIPYYFRFYDSKMVYYYTSKDWNYKKVVNFNYNTLPFFFTKGNLLKADKKALLLSILQIANKLRSCNHFGSSSIKELTVTFGKKITQIKIGKTTYETPY